MKKIDTSHITSTAGYPPSKKGLDFLQDSYKEVVSDLARHLIGTNYSAASYYLLYGMAKTGLGGSNYSYTAGAVYHNGEIYTFDAVASISITDTDVLTITTTPDATADPTTMDDGTVVNIHDVRTLVMSSAASGSGSVNYNDLVKFYDSWHYVGGTDALGTTFLNSWANDGSGTYQNLAFIREEHNKFVSLRGRITAGASGTTVFTLPAGYRPPYNQLYITQGDSTGYVVKVTITTAGSVSVEFSSGTDVFLDGVRFSITDY